MTTVYFALVLTVCLMVAIGHLLSKLAEVLRQWRHRGSRLTLTLVIEAPSSTRTRTKPCRPELTRPRRSRQATQRR